MFALEINFHDGVSSTETLLVRRPYAVVGGSEFAHVIIEGTGAEFSELQISRGLGREFTCEPIETTSKRRQMQFLEGTYLGEAEVNLGSVTAHITTLDADLKVFPEEPADQAGIRILRRALSKPMPSFPAVGVLGNVPIIFSFAPDQPIVIGRSQKCGLRLDAADVSGEHARIGFEDGKIWIEDLGSTNGTFVSGERINGRYYLEIDEQAFIGSDFTLVPLLRNEDVSKITAKKKGRREASIAMRLYPCLYSNSDLVKPKRFVFLKSDTISIGRDPANDIWVGAPHISRVHCELTMTDLGNFEAIDRSSNGTFYEGSELPKDVNFPLPEGLRVLDFGSDVLIGVCANEKEEREFLNSIGEDEIEANQPDDLDIKVDDRTTVVPTVGDEIETEEINDGKLGQRVGIFEQFAKEQSSSENILEEDDNPNSLTIDNDSDFWDSNVNEDSNLRQKEPKNSIIKRMFLVSMFVLFSVFLYVLLEIILSDV